MSSFPGTRPGSIIEQIRHSTHQTQPPKLVECQSQSDLAVRFDPVMISVVIPAYNAAATIQATVDSVLQQTVCPFEILILDDGSTDSTPSLLKRYEPRVSVVRQENSGVAAARNALCELARGDLVAFLDHDDLWHPRYLEVQSRLFAKYPDASAFFTGHTNFTGYGHYEWRRESFGVPASTELIDPVSFLRRYNESTGDFASMSYCCIPKRVLAELGSEPFCLAGVDDSYLCTRLPLLLRPVVYTQLSLVAYRITGKSQSVNRLKTYGFWVDVFRMLEPLYVCQDTALLHAFRLAFASRRRQFAKVLMTAGRVADARRELRLSMNESHEPQSLAKSLGLLLASYMPSPLQPVWRPIQRSEDGR